MRTATPTPTAKNNSKYNNCTLECIELGTCTELSLKFFGPFLELSRLRGRNKQKLFQYLFSFMEKHLIVFLFTKFKSKKQNPDGPHKVKSE